MISSGWKKARIGEIAEVKGGKRLPAGYYLQATPTHRPYIRVADMRVGGVDQSDIKYVPEGAISRIQNYRIYIDDIFISVAGTLGIVGRVPISLDGANLTENADRLTNIKCDVAYLMYALQSNPIQDEIDSIRTVGAQPKLALSRIRSFEILMPSDQAEQSRVSRALSDTDDLIESLERLISKKQAIKQGVMHELLTGRTRLPGFDAKWSTEKMGSILRVRHGRSQAGIEKSNGRYPILATGGEIGRTNIPIYSHPSVLIGRKGTIDRPQYRDEPFWTVDTLFYTEIFPRAVPLYIFYLFQTIDWKSMNEASGVPSLNSSRIESIEVVLPNLEEQKAIAQILQDVDQEIDTLERRLESARNIKQGMMQELLSGRTRLSVQEVAP